MTSALAWLGPRNPLPLIEADLGDDGMAGARFDGLVAPTHAGRVAAADVLSGPEGRAVALRGQLPRGGALARLSAVWVHTGRMGPRRIEVLVAPRRRVQGAAIVHRQVIDPGDVEPVGGVLVTTPARTAVDLLCFAEESAAVAGTTALLTAGLDARTAWQALDRTGRAHRQRAAALLARICAGEERSRS